ncbi:LOW QUALITY PROTEIN: suppressor of cytokine signaling 1a [Leucoraja erinacea]|uniref:LOW QUALITY PROTEIN: suppressor of cytokine signaling 1a n=1 Tax=Leucoraja erinaceus TaxID=7782 RepID=UPI0024590BFF|nr:LOW QUALITY PROTEIN: suppressor of cytokine signaling 1a [Leucoraja erinacea]
MVADRNLIDRAADARVQLEPQVLEALEHDDGAQQPDLEHQPARARPRSRQMETHFKIFRSESDFHIITRTWRYLEDSGFYWGPMSVEVAHNKLKSEPVGTFLVRDSRQKDYFFSLSVKTANAPISFRIQFQDGLFGLDGSQEHFSCVMKLIEHFMTSPRKLLSKPLRKVRLRSLQGICRARIIESSGRENIEQLPLNHILRDYLKTFPFRI